MSVRTFDNMSYICGWFDTEGRHLDVQQYSTKEMAEDCAKRIKDAGYSPYVGVIVEGTSLNI